VHEMRNKHVVHVGFGGHSNDLRSKCHHRIDLGRDRMFRRMQRSGDAADSTKAAASTAATARPPAAKRSGGGGQA